MNGHLIASQIKEGLARYGSEIWRERLGLALLMLAAVLFVLPPVRRACRRLSPRVGAALVGLVLGVSAISAWRLKWLCDDAFISFRYADNLARGLGLVFNAGERVEGYTNFLWTVLLALAARLGLRIELTALFLGIACFCAVCGLVARIGSLACTRAGAGREPGPGPEILLPLAAAVVCLNYILGSFATSGLETMFAVLLLLVALERAMIGQPLAAGLCGIAAVMAHPDHAILYAALGFALLLENRRAALRYALPLGLLYVPYFLWRWHYYGELMPNTFYAKSADRAYFSQGFVYLGVSGLEAGLWAALPLALVGAWARRKELLGRYFLIGVPLFLFYVAKIGGDFMLGRLLCPLLPLVFILAEVGARGLLARGRLVPVVVGLMPLGLAALPLHVVRPWEKLWHVADERSFYQIASLRPVRIESIYFQWARELEKAFTARGLFPKLSIDCVGMLGYYTRLPILDNFGLTDRTVAHQPLKQRGRPGHEKIAGPAYIADHAALSDRGLYPEPYHTLSTLELPGVRFFLSRYDPALISPLVGAPGIHFVNMDRYLDGYLGVKTARDAETLSCDAWFLARYYLSKNVDPARRQALEQAIAASDPSLGEAAPFLLDGDPGAQGWRALDGFSFDSGSLEGWQGDVRAVSSWPARGNRLGQDTISGQTGSFLDTYDPDAGDDARGRLVSPPFRIQGDLMTLRVGGGRNLAHLRVALRVGGAAVRQATGCNSEMMGQRAWNVAPFAGQEAELEVVDDMGGGWGHLLLDEVQQWARPPTQPIRQAADNPVK